MYVKTTMRYCLTPPRIIMKKTRDNKCWQECPGKGTLLVEIQTGTATTESRMEIPWGKKMGETKKPTTGFRSWLKAQHSENEDHGIQSHHFMANR